MNMVTQIGIFICSYLFFNYFALVSTLGYNKEKSFCEEKFLK